MRDGEPTLQLPGLERCPGRAVRRVFATSARTPTAYLAMQAKSWTALGDDVRVMGDIGCYSLGDAGEPLRAIHSCLCMGSSIGMAIGAAHAGMSPALCVIGDGTFTHSGMTPLLDAVRENVNIKVFILDNSIVAMTGGQADAGDRRAGGRSGRWPGRAARRISVSSNRRATRRTTRSP